MICERSLVDNIPELKEDEKYVPRHIKHRFSDVMTNMTFIVPLGLSEKKSSADGMLDILEDYKPYLPSNGDTKVLCGGDLFTYKRLLQAYLSKINEPDHASHRLRFVFEHWHAEVMNGFIKLVE